VLPVACSGKKKARARSAAPCPRESRERRSLGERHRPFLPQRRDKREQGRRSGSPSAYRPDTPSNRPTRTRSPQVRVDGHSQGEATRVSPQGPDVATRSASPSAQECFGDSGTDAGSVRELTGANADLVPLTSPHGCAALIDGLPLLRGVPLVSVRHPRGARRGPGHARGRSPGPGPGGPGPNGWEEWLPNRGVARSDGTEVPVCPKDDAR